METLINILVYVILFYFIMYVYYRWDGPNTHSSSTSRSSHRYGSSSYSSPSSEYEKETEGDSGDWNMFSVLNSDQDKKKTERQFDYERAWADIYDSNNPGDDYVDPDEIYEARTPKARAEIMGEAGLDAERYYKN